MHEPAVNVPSPPARTAAVVQPQKPDTTWHDGVYGKLKNPPKYLSFARRELNKVPLEHREAVGKWLDGKDGSLEGLLARCDYGRKVPQTMRLEVPEDDNFYGHDHSCRWDGLDPAGCTCGAVTTTEPTPPERA